MNNSPLRGLLAVLLVCQLFSCVCRAASPAQSMAEAAKKYVASLTPEQQAKGVFEFKNEERFNWHFIPKSRNGLPFKEMTPAQRELAHALLRSALSPEGYTKS